VSTKLTAQPSPTAIRAAAVLLIACGLAAPAFAQSVADRLEEADRVLPDVIRPERVVMPTREQAAEPVSPGLTGGTPWDNAGAPPARLPEGTFLIERPGYLLPAPNERSVFVPDTDARLPGEGPMLALPNAALDRLEITLDGAPQQIRVSGEVFVYRDRRYLMVTSFQIGPAPAEPEAEQETAPESEGDAAGDTIATEPADDPTIESLLDDPEVRGLLAELESEAPPPTRVDREQTPTTPAITDGSQAATAPDGTPVFRRRGRLVRSGSGAWLFVFDNDTDDRLAAASMTVLPCRLLERVERDAQALGDAAQVSLSGRVYVHRGEAYLLPTMMTRVRVTDIVPMR